MQRPQPVVPEPSISIETVQPEPIIQPVIKTAPKKGSLEYQLDLHREKTTWASEVGMDDFGIYADVHIAEKRWMKKLLLDNGGVTQRFRLIQSGTFWMGSPETETERWAGGETRHQVTISKAFWLADTVCTQALWEIVIGSNPAHFKDNPNNPVEIVSWKNVQDFLQKLNSLQTGLSVQLPTEAQWEFACRAETETPFSFGKNITPEQVNYNGNQPYTGGAKGLYREKTIPVKSLAANAWGLYEMHGNVWEWCQDAFKADLGSEASTDPLSKLGDFRVLRGGSWFDGGRLCRSAYLIDRDPSLANRSVGFRLSQVSSA